MSLSTRQTQLRNIITSGSERLSVPPIAYAIGAFFASLSVHYDAFGLEATLSHIDRPLPLLPNYPDVDNDHIQDASHDYNEQIVAFTHRRANAEVDVNLLHEAATDSVKAAMDVLEAMLTPTGFATVLERAAFDLVMMAQNPPEAAAA